MTTLSSLSPIFVKDVRHELATRNAFKRLSKGALKGRFRRERYFIPLHCFVHLTFVWRARSGQLTEAHTKAYKSLSAIIRFSTYELHVQVYKSHVIITYTSIQIYIK